MRGQGIVAVDDPRRTGVLGHQPEVAVVATGDLVGGIADRLRRLVDGVFLQGQAEQLTVALHHAAAHLAAEGDVLLDEHLATYTRDLERGRQRRVVHRRATTVGAQACLVGGLRSALWFPTCPTSTLYGCWC